ncbi:MAG: hypothetical protein ACTSSC_09865 [Promethearchaeota archaeon]
MEPVSAIGGISSGFDEIFITSNNMSMLIGINTNHKLKIHRRNIRVISQLKIL